MKQILSAVQNSSLSHYRRWSWYLAIVIIFLILLNLLDIGLSFRQLRSRPLLNLAEQQVIAPSVNLASFHLFGVFDQGLQDLPQTNLQLVLQGTLVNRQDKSQSLAIVASPNKPAKVYRVGDTLPGDATLKAVLAKQIVLDNNGELQSLSLPKVPL